MSSGTGVPLMGVVLAVLVLSGVGSGADAGMREEYKKFAGEGVGLLETETGAWFWFRVRGRRTDGEMETVEGWAGRVGEVQGDRENNLVVTLNHRRRTLAGLLETERDGEFWFGHRGGHWGERSQWRRVEEAPREDEVLEEEGGRGRGFVELQAEAGERDGLGRYVVDVFVGFSHSAAGAVGDIDTVARSYVDQGNAALRNSGVTTVYLRLVGVGSGSPNPGVVTQALRDGKGWFAAEIERFGPDIITLVQTPTGATGSAAGWAYVRGDINVIGTPWPGAFKHEVGHNAGGGHCREAGSSGYAYGYDGTSMCGNRRLYYSTPLVRDGGDVIGFSGTHDMARVWRERAATMSGRRIHKVPFDRPPVPPPPSGSSCSAVLGVTACDGSECYTCGARIEWKQSSVGGSLSRADAERFVGTEFPTECGPCAKTCESVLSVVACAGSECYTCGARIDWKMSVGGLSRSAAEKFVGNEFPNECGACT